MPYNLLNEHWLPVRRAQGEAETIAPWELTKNYADNPIVALDFPRPDFNGAAIQWLIGLVQTAFAPAEDRDWRAGFKEAPSPETLQAAFARYQDAFNLDGDGPRFMQDLDPLADKEALPVNVLLIDTMGSETHFVKGMAQQGMSPGIAAIALYAYQTNAPSGGAGHRTSLRGGGPLTTLVIAEPEADSGRRATLWDTVWLNVLEQAEFTSERQQPADIFPWLAPTRASDKSGRDTSPEDVNPLQMYWGMPRRIRLDFEKTGSGECALSGAPSAILVKQYRTRNYGVNYVSGLWQHPLSPHNKDTKQTLPVHPNGAVNYRHWLGLVQENKDGKVQRIPAKVVQAFKARRLERKGMRFRLWAFGYDMDNMKPRCWYEATLPLFHLASREDRQAFELAAQNLILAAGEFVWNLRGCLKDAWFEKHDPRAKKADMSFVDSAFWHDTEGRFYDLLNRLHTQPQNAETRKAVYNDWHSYLRKYTLQEFDRWANSNQIADQHDPLRVVRAQQNLQRFNWKKTIKDYLELPT